MRPATVCGRRERLKPFRVQAASLSWLGLFSMQDLWLPLMIGCPVIGVEARGLVIGTVL